MSNFDTEITRDQTIVGLIRPGPVLAGHSIQYNEKRHAWIIDQTLVACTLSEYHYLKLLLEHANRCMPFAHFIECLQEVSDPTLAMQKEEKLKIAHVMSALRAKVWALGLDIVSVMNVGYILLSDIQEASLPP